MNDSKDNEAAAEPPLDCLVGSRVPFCSDELNELLDEFMEVMCELGMTEIDDVIDTAIARCAVKKSRREHARRLIETAFDVLREVKAANV